MTTFTCSADTSKITTLEEFLYDDATSESCEKLLAVPWMDTSSVTTWRFAFKNCKALTSIPVYDMSATVSLYSTWEGCVGLTTFPSLQLGSNPLYNTWSGCSNIISFGSMDYSQVKYFFQTWRGCTKLKCFDGTLKFSVTAVNNRRTTTPFSGCAALVSPASTGTPVRNGDDILAGTWANTNPCP